MWVVSLTMIYGKLYRTGQSMMTTKGCVLFVWSVLRIMPFFLAVIGV